MFRVENEVRLLLHQADFGEVEVGGGGPDDAIRSCLVGVGIEVIVEGAIDGLAGEDEGKEAGSDAIEAEPIAVHGPGLRASEFEPIENSDPGLNALGDKRFDAGQSTLAELRECGSVVGGCQHDEMAHGAE